MTTVTEIIREHSRALHASSSPRLDTELLLAHCLKVDRSALFREPERRLTAAQSECITGLLEQRLAGRPVAQLLGKTEFYSLELEVDAHVLCPRADTETLVDEALKIIGSQTVRVIDLGTGSGAIAIAVAKHCPSCEVLALDNSSAALQITSKNIARHELKNVMTQQSNWLDGIEDVSVEMIISNPPYVASGDPLLKSVGVKFEPRQALDGGEDGLDAYRTLIPQAFDKLKPGGYLLLEHGYTQAENIRELLSGHRFKEITTHPDLAGHERICRARK